MSRISKSVERSRFYRDRSIYLCSKYYKLVYFWFLDGYLLYNAIDTREK